jgi:hypothetical protein
LDCLIDACGQFVILSIFCVVFYFLYLIVFRHLDSEKVVIVRSIAENWKAVLLITLPLFYVPIRTFLEEAYEVLGVKRPQSQTPVSEETVVAPPSTEQEGK